ncbi:MAG: hypothetical protein IJ209_00300 [Bacteroidaceae bacterium]|nr:hypothetical protein [Bacteroidaceae bacterium]
MLFDKGQTTEQMTTLITEARNYWNLQRKNISLETTEVLTRLLTAIALWGIIILVGALVLLFASFALAYLLGVWLGSEVWGFAIIAGVLLFITLLIYVNRTAWIAAPVGKFMVSLFASQMQDPTREAVAMEKAHVKEKLDESQTLMRTTASSLFSPKPQSKDRWDRATRLLANGVDIYRAVQFGLSAVTAVATVFGLGRRKRRRR